ncbi:MAG: sugar phosphate isomerase/epimerase family protein, partial [Candidatus Limnocylindrales bacterium]
MRLDLGIDNCFAVKRWPRAADWGPIVRDHLGLRLVQHTFDLVDLAVDDPADLQRDLGDLDLVLHSTFTGLAAYSSNLLLHPEPKGAAAAEAWYRAAIDWTAAAGGVATGGHIGAFSVPDWTEPVVRQARWSDLQASLSRLAEAARTAGLDHLLVENLASAREPSTMAMIRELVTGGDDRHVPIRLCLDVGHMCVPGTARDERDPYAWLTQMGGLATVVQLQQSDAQGDHHWPFTAARNTKGRIEADRVIDALGEGGVDACALILEVIPPFEQPDDELLDDLGASVD